MSPSVQLSLEPLKECIKKQTKTHQDAREIQSQVEDGDDVLDPDNCRSVLSKVHKTINNKFEHEFLHEGVWLLISHRIYKLTAVLFMSRLVCFIN